jgi:hypothetical protein
MTEQTGVRIPRPEELIRDTEALTPEQIPQPLPQAGDHLDVS